MKPFLLALGVLAATTAAQAQRIPEPKPAAQGFLVLPVALGDPIFTDLTSVLAQLDGSFQLPVYKGFGVGVGLNASFFELNEFGLGAQTQTLGFVDRIIYYGKLNYVHYTGPVTFVQVEAKLGPSSWNWNCSTCAESIRQPGFHWGLDAGYFVHATDNLAFGLTLGYDADNTSFGPDVIGLEHFPGRTDTGAPYRFLTVGLGFSTGFAKASGEGLW